VIGVLWFLGWALACTVACTVAVIACRFAVVLWDAWEDTKAIGRDEHEDGFL
jgi:hypothetical protein